MSKLKPGHSNFSNHLPLLISTPGSLSSSTQLAMPWLQITVGSTTSNITHPLHIVWGSAVMAINSKVRRDKRLPRLLAAAEAVEQPWQSCFCYLEESWVERKTRLCPCWGTVLGILLGECDTGCYHPVSSARLCTALGHLPKSNICQEHGSAKGSNMEGSF